MADRLGFALIAVLLGALASGAPAAAQVMEIAPDGSVVTYSGPTQFDRDGARPIQPPAPAARQADPPVTVSAAIHGAAQRYALSDRLVEAVAWRESGFSQAAVSAKGARGVMQLMPSTARRLGVDAGDLAANVAGGAAYLAQMLHAYDGDLARALAAYNAGPAAVNRFGGVPPYGETHAYVNAILDRLSRQATAP
jgi:soluble lytic murein transglycosylase-like protein